MPSTSNHDPRHSLSDPLSAVLRPPANETPAEREVRVQKEVEAKKVSDAIDEQIRQEKAMLKKHKADVKVLLLGQSESGKSTTLKQFQLLHTPAAFHAERIAWRSVIYLNLVRSIRRILDAISPDAPDPYTYYSHNDDLDDSFDSSSISTAEILSHTTSNGSGGTGGAGQDTAAAAEKYAYYSQRLAPLVDLEERLMKMLSEEEGEDEATRLDDGSRPGWSSPPQPQSQPRSGKTTNGTTSPRFPSPPPNGGDVPLAAPTPVPATSRLMLSKELSVRTTSRWKEALSFPRSKGLKARSPDTSEVVGWWEDPSDPVHILSSLRLSMIAVWNDPWVRARLQEKRIRLEESSGFYLDEIERITAKKYIPTDEDVLKARLKTMGVVEHTFVLNGGIMGGGGVRGSNWKIYDVGGARNQRQAWAPYFQDVNAIIFLAPISAFDQVLAEDSRVNRLEDSLLLWRSVCSNKLLSHVNIVLFLNKVDLLQKKLDAGVKLAQHLISYGDRPNDYDSVSKYLKNKFGLLHQQCSPDKSREIHIHFTAVTDTRRTATIIQDVRDFILKANLKNSELIS